MESALLHQREPTLARARRALTDLLTHRLPVSRELSEQAYQAICRHGRWECLHARILGVSHF